MEKHQIIYIGDPLCSWCWGAAEELTKLKVSNKNMVFKVLLGGLRPYTRTTMSEKQKTFLKQHWREIGTMTKQVFNFDILTKDDFIYNTEPPARAVWTMRQLNPSVEFDFFKAIQYAFYSQGKDTNLTETYLELCEDFFVERADFEILFLKKSTKEATEEEFDKARMLGVTGFPTILVKIGKKYKPITRGYDTFENMQANLNSWIEKLG